MTAPAPDLPKKSWPDYRAVWRWHFYASLFSTPFVVMLSITGAIYLFKTEIEAWNEREYDQLTLTTPASIAEQVKSALAAHPDSIPQGYELPATNSSAGRVIVRTPNAESVRVYIDPQTLKTLASVHENERLMRVMFRLHGELLMGDRGSNLVELAASWTIIMIVTGLFLWWPRGATSWGGIIYPRFNKGSRIFWRDIHSVTGAWISLLALFLLMTGLPWAKFWGNYFKTVRTLTGTAVAQQDWTTGSERPTSPTRETGGEHNGHGGSGRSRRGKPVMPKDLAAFDRVAAVVQPLQLESPVVIAPPSAGSDNWTAKSMTPNRPYRVNLVVNGTTGEIVSRENFRDRHIIDQIVGVGIAAHEGRLFGWMNQLLGLLTAAGLILLSLSGVVMWWRRRDPGMLGAPRRLVPTQFSIGLMTLIVLLGICLPLFAFSLIVVVVVEWCLLRRVPRLCNWLGLNEPRDHKSPSVDSATTSGETQ